VADLGLRWEIPADRWLFQVPTSLLATGRLRLHGDYAIPGVVAGHALLLLLPEEAACFARKQGSAGCFSRFRFRECPAERFLKGASEGAHRIDLGLGDGPVGHTKTLSRSPLREPTLGAAVSPIIPQKESLSLTIA